MIKGGSQMDEKKDVYRKIREARRKKGLTVNKLAAKMGENHQKVGRIERGCHKLTIDYLIKASKALDTPLETFLSQEFSKNDSDQHHQTAQIPIINKIVVLIEENNERLPSSLSAIQKGKLASKLYELVKKFPESYQQIFLDAFFEGFFVIYS